MRGADACMHTAQHALVVFVLHRGREKRAAASQREEGGVVTREGK